MKTVKEIPSQSNEVVVPSSDTPVATIASPKAHAPRDALPTEARPDGSTVEVCDPSHWELTGGGTDTRKSKVNLPNQTT